MFSTEYGDFDGDSWEKFCQICLKQKYDNFRPMEAHTNGDLGIEGYIEVEGKVYQCYCPDENYSSKDLYEKQRDKITTDLKKIEKYHVDLSDYIKDSKIKEWIFLTPKVLNKELNKHCVTKREEYRIKNIDILDDNFDVIYKDIEYFMNYLPEDTIISSFKISGSKIKLNNNEISLDEIIDWKGTHTDLSDNIYNKLSKLFSSEEKIKRNEHIKIENYLGGLQKEELLRTFGTTYEKFFKLKNTLEKKAIEICDLYGDSDPKKAFNDISNILETEIKQYLGNNVDDMEILNLKEYIISDWFARCPIRFD